MTADRLDIHYRAGKVRRIEVVVGSRRDDGQYQVCLIDTYEGISEIGEPFIGKGALRRSSVFSESVLAALVCADITWTR